MLLVVKASPNVIGNACLSLRTGSQTMTTEKIVYPLSALWWFTFWFSDQTWCFPFACSSGKRVAHEIIPEFVIHNALTVAWRLLLTYFQVVIQKLLPEKSSTLGSDSGLYSGGWNLSVSPSLSCSCCGARAVKSQACPVALQSFTKWQPCQTKAGQFLVAAQRIWPFTCFQTVCAVLAKQKAAEFLDGRKTQPGVTHYRPLSLLTAIWELLEEPSRR